MAKLTCEMCNGTDFAKQDGFFVCQGCGVKYSVEEAKKIMGNEAVAPAEAPQHGGAKVDNLLQLAQSSYDSKNYAQAENFCNEILALDASNYAAWKLKGEAVNYQITVSNDRIEEVYNCIMTSYRVLDEAGKAARRDEVLASLRVCLEGEIAFVFDAFRNNRGEAILGKLKATIVNCGAKILDSYSEMGYSADEAEEYRIYILNYVIEKANKEASHIWDHAVWANYYRNGFSDSYQPTDDILATYLDEGSNLVELLHFMEQFFSDAVPLEVQQENYRLQNLFHSKLINGQSYVRMVSTTTNGYGAVIGRREYWQASKSPTAEAKSYRRKEMNRLQSELEGLAKKMAAADPVVLEKQLAAWIEERDRLDLNPKPANSGFAIVFLLFGAVFSYLAFSGILGYGRDVETIKTLLGIIGVIGLGGGSIGWFLEKKKANEIAESNRARYNQLTQKINEYESLR